MRVWVDGILFAAHIIGVKIDLHDLVGEEEVVHYGNVGNLLPCRMRSMRAGSSDAMEEV